MIGSILTQTKMCEFKLVELLRLEFKLDSAVVGIYSSLSFNNINLNESKLIECKVILDVFYKKR